MLKLKNKPNSTQKLAVFDIDGTIFRSSLLIELAEALIEARVFPRIARSYYMDSHEKWARREGGYEVYIMDVVKTYLKFIKGVKRSDIWNVADKVVKEQKKYTYRYTRDLVTQLKKKNFYLLAVSLSPYEIVTPFAKEFGFDKAYGHVYEVDEKVRYTGNMLYEDVMKNKDKVIQRTIEKEGLSLKGSIGVGDTESDINLLKIVDRAIAFNPSSELYKVAKRRKWEIVLERKDVIYRL